MTNVTFGSGSHPICYSYKNRYNSFRHWHDDSEDRGYTYDAAWNLSYRTNTSSTDAFQPNALNEATMITEGTQNYDNNYDGNGSMTSFSDTSGNGYNFTFDAENRLTQVEAFYGGSSGGVMTFQYDGLGRLRISTNWDGTTTDYIYDGMRVIQERDGNNTPQVSYTRGPDLSGTMEGAGGIGGLLARSAGYSAGNWSTHDYYHADGNGNIMYLETGSQGLAASYRYDAYGETLQWNGPLAFANMYQFSSKQRVQIDPLGAFEFEGIYYYGYRFYAPHLQRWLNRDPLAGWPTIQINAPKSNNSNVGPWETFVDPNLYEYIYNTPQNNIDADGLWGVGVTGGASGDVGAGVTGAGATGALGAGIFWGGPSGVNAGAFASGGAFVRESPGVVSIKCPNYNQTPWAIGAYAGAGAGGFLTNAKRASDLSGPFKQWNLNTPIGSINFGWSAGTFILSVTTGPGDVASISGYPTSTIATH